MALPLHSKSCSFASLGKCFLETYTKAKKVRIVCSEEVELLSLRSKLAPGDIYDICSHHEKVYLHKYSVLQRSCSNAFGLHEKPRKKSLREITVECRANALGVGVSLVPGDKLCSVCRTHLQELLPLQVSEESLPGPSAANVDMPGPSTMNVDIPWPSSSTESVPSDDSATDCMAGFDEVLQVLHLSPIKLGGLNSPKRFAKAQSKYQRASTVLKRKLEESYHTSLGDLQEPEPKKTKTDAKELALYRDLMESLKNKFQHSDSYQEKLQILTLSPFTIEETQKFFGATNYMVKKSRNLREIKGVMAVPEKMSKGRKLSEAQKAEVTAFYESDEVSRICPGRKDAVSVRLPNGDKSRMQKRLVLANLKEVYSSFKMLHPISKVGFSTFASLRPPWCVLAGSPGTHSVCVCVHHQNPKLMLQSLIKKLDITECIRAAVCDVTSQKCMMNYCKSCPGKEGVVRLLNSSEELDLSEEITYRQWLTTDRCTLLTVTESVETFIESLATKVVALTRHHYVAEMQSKYLRQLKETIPTSECIILGDFSENFSFVVQDAAQGYHWENTQATLHPFIVYYRSEDGGDLSSECHCIISDCTKHTTSTVYAFQEILLEGLKAQHPSITKVHYFSDGCAGQYKNCHNFTNLCFHQEDFGLLAEWNFFATSHGKTACDGIGGTAKRLTLKASLQRPVSDQILTPQDMFSFCNEHIPGIKFHFVSKQKVLEAENFLEERFQNSRTIKGTQKYHRFIPQSTTTLAVHEISSSVRTAIVSVVESLLIDTSDVMINSYIACIYDGEIWFGIVQQVSQEFGDFFIQFMHLSFGAKRFEFPKREDTCWIHENDILCTIEPPNITSGRGGYSISEESQIKASKARKLWDKAFK